jgi:hypothetical protein
MTTLSETSTATLVAEVLRRGSTAATQTMRPDDVIRMANTMRPVFGNDLVDRAWTIARDGEPARTAG